MKGDLINITLNDRDQPVLTFTHNEKSRDLEQKLIGALIRQIGKQGIQLHLVRQYVDSEGRPLWDYEIGAYEPDFPETNETD